MPTRRSTSSPPKKPSGRRTSRCRTGGAALRLRLRLYRSEGRPRQLAGPRRPETSSMSQLARMAVAADVVMQNSRVEATWTDENGERSDPGGVWALATLEMDSVRGKGGTEGQGKIVATGRSGPAWLDRLPGEKGKLYATGYSGPTYHSEDARKYAGA